MPSIDVAMVQSLARRKTVLDILTAALQPVLKGRDVASVEGQINDVKTAFSSWDNCMQANICKWPVIAIIIVGGLIILSIVWCIVRCCCCGLSCCCECCYCLKCCGDCLGCCDPPRGKPHKYLDEPYIPPHHGYRSEAPMASGAMSAGPTYKPPVHDVPQYADFDVSKPGARGGEDALPAMPSWENANSKKVYLEEEAVEMDNLKKPENVGQNVPLMTGPVSPGSTSPGPGNNPNPNSPYAANNMGGHPAVSNGYLAAGAIPAVAGAAAAEPYGRNSPGHISPQQSGIVDHGADYGQDYGYGASAMGPGRQSPRQYNNQQRPGYGASPPPQQQQQQGYGRNNQGGNYYDEYRRNGSGMPMGQQQQQQQPYGGDRRSPRMPPNGMGGNNPPNGADYGAGSGPGRYGSPGPYGGPNPRSPPNNRPQNSRPPPLRQFAGPAMGNNANNNYNNNNNDGYGSAAMPASPTLQNNAGFDFSSGYSRPAARGRDDYNNGYDNGYDNGYNNDHSVNNSNSPPPVAQPQPERPGYPGYRAYRG